MGRSAVDMVNAYIESVAYYLPETELTNEKLSEQFPEWSVEKIGAKTGIRTRHIAGDDVYSSDLASEAARRVFEQSGIDPQEIDFLILCTQSPDYFMPITAGIVHGKLGLRYGIGATDINLGCSGYVYGLGLAKGLIETSIASKVLLLTVDTYTRYLNPRDKSVRTIFGDGAAATIVSGDSETPRITAVSYGTDGSGAGALIVPRGGLGDGVKVTPKSAPEARSLTPSRYDLYMDGPAIFNFTLEVVPSTVRRVLSEAGLVEDDIDLYVFHQANAFMLEHLRKKLGIDSGRFFVSLENSGNTVSSTIPIALAEAEHSGVLKKGMRVMLMGFGVGLSWGGLITIW